MCIFIRKYLLLARLPWVKQARLASCNERLRRDKRVVEAYVLKWPENYKWAADSLRADRQFFAVLERQVAILQFALPSIQDDEESVRLSVASHQDELRHASPRLAGNKEIVMAALHQDVNNVRNADIALLGDKEIVLTLLALDRHNRHVRLIATNLLLDPEIKSVIASNEKWRENHERWASQR